MRNSDTDTVTVSASGTAQTTFTSVKYSARVRTTGRSGPEAKENAKPVIQKIREVIATQAKSAGIDTARLQSDFAVTLNQRHNHVTGQQEMNGYNATYTIAFTGTNVGQATKLHDALTSIDGAEADSPQFCVDKKDQMLENQAFEDAVSKVRTRFASQCQALGLKVADYELVTWSLGHDSGHRGGKMMAMAEAAGGSGPVELEPGKAEHTVSITVTFARKRTAAAPIRQLPPGKYTPPTGPG